MLFSDVRPGTRIAQAATAFFACGVLVLLSSVARGQETQLRVDDSRARIEYLEKEVQTLKALLQNQAPTPAQPVAPAPLDAAAVRKIFDQYTAEKGAQEQSQKKAEQEQKKREGSVVGDDLKFNVT